MKVVVPNRHAFLYPPLEVVEDGVVTALYLTRRSHELLP